ncbi:Ubiquitin carboxyl-terminal hydrolase 44-B, partial [Penicillium subrubescens]
DWLDRQPQDGSDRYGPQDVLEFVVEILKQLSEDLSGPLLDSLNDMITIHAFDHKTCTGDKGCGNTASNLDSFPLLTVQFPEVQDSQTLEQAIEDSFDKEVIDAMCIACEANPLEAELVLTEVPEVLIVHLGRIGERDTRPGETERFKINSQIDFPEETIIKKEWLDPRLGGIRKDIKYVLSSVILHQSETTDGGHYMAVVKSENGTWTLTDDTHLRTYESFGEMAGTRIIRETAYIFTYRRLPLVTRGPEISLKESLQNAKYSDPEPAKIDGEMEIDKTSAGSHSSIEIDEAPAQPDGTMDIDPVPVNGTNAAGRPQAPRVVQQYDETEIELDEKQRGTLEVRFTTNTGVTTLKVHVKGMLWNELKDSRRRASAGRRPITRSVATSKQASDAVPPKPVKIVKINPKAGILEKKPSSELVNGKKGQLEKISPRSPGRVVKRDAPKQTAPRKTAPKKSVRK